MKDTALHMDVHNDEVFASHTGLCLVDLVAPLEMAERLRVLIVEDDEADIFLIKRALARNPRIGEVVVAHDGIEALQLIDHWATELDLAIVDLHMPRKDGLSLLRDFALRDTPKFPMVVLTSSRYGADAVRARKRGAFAYLVKPNTVAKLATVLDEVIAMI